MSTRGNSRSDIIDIACVIVRETERAYCIDAGATDDDGKSVNTWVPKSLCEWDAFDNTLAMPEWLAEEKGLI